MPHRILVFGLADTDFTATSVAVSGRWMTSKPWTQRTLPIKLYESS
jgi:hypothetical protein